MKMKCVPQLNERLKHDLEEQRQIPQSVPRTSQPTHVE